MVQCGDIIVCHSLFEPDEQNQRCFHEHRDQASDEFCIVLTLELTKRIEHRSIEHSEVRTGSPECVSNHQLPLADVAEIGQSAGDGFQLNNLGAADVELADEPLNCLL